MVLDVNLLETKRSEGERERRRGVLHDHTIVRVHTHTHRLAGPRRAVR